MTTVVADTSPINYLLLIGEIDLLPRLLGGILLPPAVHRELTHADTPVPVRAWAETLPGWARVVAPKTIDPSLKLGDGETEAICLAQELKADVLLIDERLGREAARSRGLHTAGTLLLLAQGHEDGHLDFDAAVAKLLQTTFRASPVIVEAVRKRLRQNSSDEPA